MRKHGMKHLLDEAFPKNAPDLSSTLRLAKTCKNRKDFHKKHRKHYDWIKDNSLDHHLDEIFGSPFLWDEKSVVEEAKKYSSRTEFRNKGKGAYHWVIRNKGREYFDVLFPKKMSKKEWLDLIA